MSVEEVLERLTTGIWLIKTQWDAGFAWRTETERSVSVGVESTFAEAVEKVAGALDPELALKVDREGATVLQALYKSEIDGRLGRMPDGIHWAVGDDWNGLQAQGVAATVSGAAGELAKAAVQVFPHSSFAQAYRSSAAGSP
jgi:hypothetical protein